VQYSAAQQALGVEKDESYLELKVLLENGGETVPLEQTALLHDLLPVLGHIIQVQLDRYVETYKG
jgi:hypothetical protein